MKLQASSRTESVSEQYKTNKNLWPWRRFFARYIDILLPGVIVFISLKMTVPCIYSQGFTVSIVSILITIFLTILLSALVISVTGTSAGKFFFGIRVFDKQNNNLSVPIAFYRELLVYAKGMAFFIPIVSFLAKYFAYNRLITKGESSWDKTLSCMVTHKEPCIKGLLLRVIGFSLYLVLSLISYSLIQYAG